MEEARPLACYPTPPGTCTGSTFYGGADDKGTVFKLTADTNTLTTLVSFNDLDGANPIGGLIADAAGNLYGTTYAGGKGGYGTIFKVDITTKRPHAAGRVQSNTTGGNRMAPCSPMLPEPLWHYVLWREG